MCIRIDMNIFCDPYLHVTCLTKTRSQSQRHAVTLGFTNKYVDLQCLTVVQVII